MFVRYRIHMIQQAKNLVAAYDWRLFMRHSAQAWLNGLLTWKSRDQVQIRIKHIIQII